MQINLPSLQSRPLIKTWIILLLIFCSPAHAILIDFDDLDPADLMGPEDLIPLSNEYQSKGVLFKSSAYLVSWQPFNTPVSLPNYVAGPGFGIEFTGDLPTYVSFFVGSSTGSAVSVAVTGPGYHHFIVTDGEIHGMVDESQSTPYRPNQFVFFSVPTGIASIGFSGQSDAYIDDLYVSNIVPEPSAFIVFILGLLGLVACRHYQDR